MWDSSPETAALPDLVSMEFMILSMETNVNPPALPVCPEGASAQMPYLHSDEMPFFSAGVGPTLLCAAAYLSAIAWYSTGDMVGNWRTNALVPVMGADHLGHCAMAREAG